MQRDFQTKIRPKWTWIIWWRIDPDTLRDQIRDYETLGWFEAARKLSVLCLGVSVLLTILLVVSGVAPPIDLADAVPLVGLAIFIYRGHRWAMIGAMLFWTLEKLVAISSSPAGVFGQVFWWFLYMKCFYLAYRVEQAKRTQGGIDIEAF